MTELLLALGGIFLFLANLLYLFRVELGTFVLFALLRVIIVWELTIPHTYYVCFSFSICRISSSLLHIEHLTPLQFRHVFRILQRDIAIFG